MVIDSELIVTTPDHPFYRDDEWIPAGELNASDEILKADGTVGIVESLEVALEPTEMYNLTVDEAHTFFVGYGQWLVHNTCDEVARDAAQAEADRVKKLGGDPTGIGKVTVIVDKHGESVVQGQSGIIENRSQLPNDLEAVVPSTSNHPDGIPPHACGEVHACKQLLDDTGLFMEFLPYENYTIATASISTGEIVDLCPNCEAWVPEYFNVVRPK